MIATGGFSESPGVKALPGSGVQQFHWLLFDDYHALRKGLRKMRFIDANVFIYAILKPKAALPDAVHQKKVAAKEIFLRVIAGEPVTTTIVHVSEVANVLKDAAGISFAGEFLSALLLKSNVVIEAVSVDDYRESVLLAQKSAISMNDALAIRIMERLGIDEIYTFTRHFTSAKVRIVQE